MKITVEDFGVTAEGKKVDLITLLEENGTYAKVTTYGARLVALGVLDKKGNIADVVQGYSSYDGYTKGCRFYGCNPGPFANRIKGAQFEIDGEVYKMKPNEGGNLLHSGEQAYDTIIWEYELGKDGVTFHHNGFDGEFGFPGNIKASITYKWNAEEKLTIDYQATTDKATYMNVTHHSYFNLNGDACETNLDHKITIFANYYLETDEGLVPTGKLLPVAGTPLDLREGQLIGKNVDCDEPSMRIALGFDHCYVIDKQGEGLAHCANVLEPHSGRTMDVYSTLPGLQFYSDNHPNGDVIGKCGKIYPVRSSFCLEPQFFPNSPNEKSFQSTLVTPSKGYHQTIIYQFNKKH